MHNSTDIYLIAFGNVGDALGFRDTCLGETLIGINIFGEALTVLHQVQCHDVFLLENMRV
jgi:hypothetical protein